MSVNRIGHMVGAQDLPPHQQRASHVMGMVLGSLPIRRQLLDWRLEHPGEQPYLLVLDSRMQAVRDLMHDAIPDAAKGMAAAEAMASAEHGGEVPETALWVRLVSRASGVQVARYLAKDEEQAQARCDQWAGFDAVGICVAGGGMVMTDITMPPSGDLATAERARRQDRARRHGR